jgi:alpha/beta superfamily hydrolase
VRTRSQATQIPARGRRLAGRLELPDEQPRAYALFAHCFTCTKDYKAITRVGRVLARRGFAVLRFDFTGLGESEGDFADTTFTTNLEDLAAAAEFLRAEYEAPQLLVGHSLGGAAVLAAAPQIAGAKAVATIGAPSDTQHLRELLAVKAPDIERQGFARVDILGRKFLIGKQLLDDLGRYRLDDAVAQLQRPLLVIHAPEDRIVGIEHARRLYDAAKQPKSLLAVEGADHLLSDPRDTTFVGEMLALWASRYVTDS